MPNKDFVLEGGLKVTIYKRRTNRNLRLSISPAGQVRVSIPAWVPYKTGIVFAKSRQEWIISQRKAPHFLRHGQAVGKAHHLEFIAKPNAQNVTSRVRSSMVTVSHPELTDVQSAAVQSQAQKACIRALRAQAEQLLPLRLSELAASHGFSYRSVKVKQLKSRWGSCDQDGNIVLNLFLMQLPWSLIDYVLMHELTHTRELKHGPVFWAAMAISLPSVKSLRKELRQHHPVLAGS